MTDLTEQWKKGKLESGWYYVQLIRGEYRIDLYIKDKNEWIDCPDAIIDAVVCAVPSYEEWQESEKYNKHLEEKIKIYERKDKQATETSIAYNELAKENEELKEILERHKKATAKAQIRSCDLEIINQQLKELLSKCLDELAEFNNSYYPETQELFSQITNAIGEKK